MDATNYKLGLKEFISIAIITVGIALSDDTPSIVFQQTKTAGWMQPIFSALFLIIPFILLLKVINHFETDDFSLIIKQILGKYIGTIIIAFLWLLLSVRIIIESAIYTNIVETMFYPNTPTTVIYFTLLLISSYIAYKGIVHIGSVSWLLLAMIKISLGIALALGMIHGHIQFLLPIFGGGEAVVLKESFLKTSVYIDLLFLCFIMPQMKSKLNFPKGVWISFIVITIELVIAFAIFIAFFDYQTVVLQNYPYMEILRFIHLGFLSNMESFFFPFWLMGTFIRFGFYLYLQLYFIQKLFHIEDVKHIIPALAFFTMLLGLLPSSPQYNLFDIKTVFLHIASPILIIFPILLWFISWIKGEFKLE